jgi:hypothetical protein
MGFLAKIKQFLGIGTVSVKVTGPSSFNADDSELKGTVVVTGKSDQTIEHVEVVFEEKFTTGRGDDAKTKEFKLGVVKLGGFSIKAGETKTVEYVLPFSYAKTSNEELAEKGGVMGGLGKLGSFASGEKSEFSITATVDVKGATFDPNDIIQVKKAK